MKFYDDVKQFRKRITTPDKVVLYLTQKIPIFSFFDSLTAFYLFIGKNEIQHPSHTHYSLLLGLIINNDCMPWTFDIFSPPFIFPLIDLQSENEKTWRIYFRRKWN